MNFTTVVRNLIFTAELPPTVLRTFYFPGTLELHTGDELELSNGDTLLLTILATNAPTRSFTAAQRRFYFTTTVEV